AHVRFRAWDRCSVLWRKPGYEEFDEAEEIAPRAACTSIRIRSTHRLVTATRALAWGWLASTLSNTYHAWPASLPERPKALDRVIIAQSLTTPVSDSHLDRRYPPAMLRNRRRNSCNSIVPDYLSLSVTPAAASVSRAPFCVPWSRITTPFWFFMSVSLGPLALSIP